MAAPSASRPAAPAGNAPAEQVPAGQPQLKAFLEQRQADVDIRPDPAGRALSCYRPQSLVRLTRAPVPVVVTRPWACLFAMRRESGPAARPCAVACLRVPSRALSCGCLNAAMNRNAEGICDGQAHPSYSKNERNIGPWISPDIRDSPERRKHAGCARP